MFSKWMRGVVISGLILGTLSGCGALDMTKDNDQVATAAVQTYQAGMTSEANLQIETATDIPVLEPTNTLTLTPTLTFTPTMTPTLTPSPTSTPDPGWPGNWTMFVLQISREPFSATVEQNGDRITSILRVKGEEYHVSGVVDRGGGKVSGGISYKGEMLAYFIWQMQPGYNLFLGRWWHGEMSGAWCGGRRGVAPPVEDKCLLRP